MPRDLNPQECSICRFTVKGNNALKGRRIGGVFYLTPEDTGLDQAGPAILLDDNTLIVLQSDDEGNAPGVARVIPGDGRDPFLLPRI